MKVHVSEAMDRGANVLSSEEPPRKRASGADDERDPHCIAAPLRRMRIENRYVVIESWEVRTPGYAPWASELAHEHDAREELRCARRRGLVGAKLYAISEDGVRYAVDW